ncbi:bifunctional RNase H/acid phosphatase [Rhodococcus sp. NPDC049939]|uniref:bifunctional RNase H/acid phosphatase n=1 Tax=Rhodococcus sp. NPDC049939 TaxID=3155511 RepID=UPI0033F8434A
MSIGRVVVEADGGSRGNPGPAGYGAVVFDAAHETVLAERWESLGVATNNVAEYRGLIAGLSAAAELGASSVDVRMDSKLVIEQMSGRWKVKHPDMIPLQRSASDLARQFEQVEYTWISRDQNSHADRLANRAMDGVVDAGLEAEPEPRAKQATRPAPGWMETQGAPTRMLLLRHAQTALSVERRYSGRGNPSLTDFGRAQADGVAKRLAGQEEITAVVSSPLDRARQTAAAAAAALGLSVTVVDGLTETDFGEWEGLTFREAADRDPELHRRWLSDTSVRPPSGESFDDVRERMVRVREDLTVSYGGATILVVTHVTPIKTLIQLALDAGPALLYRLHLDLASLSIADFYPDGGSSVRLVNDTSHL